MSTCALCEPRRWHPLSFIYLLLVSLALNSVSAAARSEVILSVNKPLNAQSIALNEVARYSLKRMLPRTMYEVRVSYPATVRVLLYWCLAQNGRCVLRSMRATIVYDR